MSWHIVWKMPVTVQMWCGTKIVPYGGINIINSQNLTYWLKLLTSNEPTCGTIHYPDGKAWPSISTHFRCNFRLHEAFGCFVWWPPATRFCAILLHPYIWYNIHFICLSETQNYIHSKDEACLCTIQKAMYNQWHVRYNSIMIKYET